MKITDYVKIVDKTAVYPDEPSLAYVILGLVGESGEFVDEFFSPATTNVKITKEAGDVYWYITAICKETGISAKHILTSAEDGPIDSLNIEETNPFEVAIALSSASSKLAEIAKKYYRDNETLEEKDAYLTKKEEDLFTLLVKVGIMVSLLCQVKGISFSDVLKHNYDKLIKRREKNMIQGEGSDREEK